MYTQGPTKTPPTQWGTGGPCQICCPSPTVKPVAGPQLQVTLSLALCEEPQRKSSRGCGAAVSTLSPWGTSREPAWAAEQEATPPPPRHLTHHPFQGPHAQGEARVGVMRSRWLSAPASDDRGPGPRWGGGPCLKRLGRSRDQGGGLKIKIPGPYPKPRPHWQHPLLQQEGESPFPHSMASWSSLPQAPTLPPALPILSGHLWNPDVEAKHTHS